MVAKYVRRVWWRVLLMVVPVPGTSWVTNSLSSPIKRRRERVKRKGKRFRKRRESRVSQMDIGSLSINKLRTSYSRGSVFIYAGNEMLVEKRANCAKTEIVKIIHSLSRGEIGKRWFIVAIFFFLNSKSSNSLFVEIYIQDGCFSYRSSKNLPFCSIGDLLEFDISVSNFQILDLFFQFFTIKKRNILAS